MPRLVFLNRHFTPRPAMTVSALAAIIFFSALGFWQMKRAEEKKLMLTEQARLGSLAPVLWTPDMPQPVQYQSIAVEGKPLPQLLLLDNQHYRHQFGYHVLTPLLLNAHQVVLIDRGWVPGEGLRQHFPNVSTPQQALRWSGQVWYPSDKMWVLGHALEIKDDNLALVEKIDARLISQFLHKSVYPFIIRLEKTAPDGFVREWAVVSMPPQRHHAYAAQWFAMAFVILVIFIGLNTKKMNEKSNP